MKTLLIFILLIVSLLAEKWEILLYTGHETKIQTISFKEPNVELSTLNKIIKGYDEHGEYFKIYVGINHSFKISKIK